MEFINNFKNVTVLIVGDLMLDRFWWGSVSRISPEAPVPVVRLDRTSLVAGGAANVAMNAAGLGAEVFLAGVVGNDAEGRIFPDLLARGEVRQDLLLTDRDRPTTVKTRVIAHQQQVVRIDQETKDPIAHETVEILWEKIEEVFDQTDILVLSDYAKGVLTADLITRLITKANQHNKYCLVDPKGKDYSKYREATLLTPNKKEAAEACKLEEDGEETVALAGRRLIAELDLEALLITRGEEGMTLFQQNQEPHNLPALAREVYDVTGAGDTVIATLAIGLAAGADFKDAAKLANLAAGLVVEQVGTTAISFAELKEEL